MNGFKGLEKKYGIKVEEDGVYFTAIGEASPRYKIFSADGCQWENGLTRHGVKLECETYAKQLLSIKETVRRMSA